MRNLVFRLSKKDITRLGVISLRLTQCVNYIPTTDRTFSSPFTVLIWDSIPETKFKEVNDSIELTVSSKGCRRVECSTLEDIYEVINNHVKQKGEQWPSIYVAVRQTDLMDHISPRHYPY